MSLKNFLRVNAPTFVGVGGSVVAGLGTYMLMSNPVLATGAALLSGIGLGIVAGLPKLKDAKGAETTPELIGMKFINSIPGDLKNQLSELRRITFLHSQGKTAVAKASADVFNDACRLLERIESKQDSQAARLAAVNYTDILGKLNKALGEDYYLDILAHPRLWNDPEGRLAAVVAATEATKDQLLKHIQQVNASRDLEFSTAIDSLMRALDNHETIMENKQERI